MHRYCAFMAPDDPAAHRSLTGIRLDAAALKVLAHPLRARLLSCLRKDGPSTATSLATQLGTNTGATSYHLRKLEDVGLVTDTGEGTGRRRLWRASTESHEWAPSDFEGDEDAETALSWLTRDYSRHLGERFERWIDVAPDWPPAWRDALGMNDVSIIATAEQVRAMTDDLLAVVEKYRRAGQGNPAARRVATYLVTYPIDHGRPPQR